VPDACVSTPIEWADVADVEPADFTIRTVPDRLRSIGDPGAGIDDHVGVLDAVLELAARDQAEGLSDAPWPPHFEKQAGEPPRVQPSKARRRSTMPLIEIARAATEAEANEGLERWKARHPAVWPYLEPADVLVDSMRGRSSTWTRIRINLRNVPESERPPQEPLEVDYDPWARFRSSGRGDQLGDS
jgi:hypothetical protein